jgi:hypothetical protein
MIMRLHSQLTDASAASIRLIAHALGALAKRFRTSKTLALPHRATPENFRVRDRDIVIEQATRILA